MILCTSASPEYFNDFFDLWVSQCNKFYPELKKHIALFKPSKKDIRKCELNGVDVTDLSDFIDKDKPEREYFFAMRWLSMLPLLETKEDLLLMQINCIPIKKQTFVDFEEDQYRMGHFKKGEVTGLSAQIFHHSTAVKVVEKAKEIIKSPPEFDDVMDMWMRNNFSTKFELCVQRVTEKDIDIKSYAHWIITRSGNGPVKIKNHTKLGILQRFI